MLERLLTMITLPPFDDEETARKAGFLNTILLTLIIFLSLYVVVRIFAGGLLFSVTTTVLTVLVVAFIVLYRLLRRGFVEFASRALVIVGWLGVTYQAWDSDGIRDVAFTAYIIVILAAGLLWGTRSFILLSSLTVLAGWFFAYSETVGWIDASMDPLQRFVVDQTVTFSLIFFLVYLFINNLTNALKRSQQSNQQLQQLAAELEQRVSERTLRTEMALQEAERAKQSAEMAQQAMSEQYWLNNTQVQLVELLRGHQTIESLASNALSYLCKVLEIPIGTLFVAQGGELRLVARYAYEPAAADATVFELGEGLIGEAAFMDELVVTNVPKGHMTIQTAVGQITPEMLYHRPLLYDNRIAGVLELGTMMPLEERGQLLLERASENIAVALQSAQDRMRINELLEKTRLQAVEWQKEAYETNLKIEQVMLHDDESLEN